MEKAIDLAITRYNDIGVYLNLPSDNLFTEIKKPIAPFQLNFVSKIKKQEIVSYKSKM